MNAKNCLLAKQTFQMIGVTAENRSPARQTLQITGLTAENRLFA
jgi:hypothetical protein